MLDKEFKKKKIGPYKSEVTNMNIRGRRFEPFMGYTHLSPTDIQIREVQPSEAVIKEEVNSQQEEAQNSTMKGENGNVTDNPSEKSPPVTVKYKTSKGKWMQGNCKNFGSYIERDPSDPSNISIKVSDSPIWNFNLL